MRIISGNTKGLQLSTPPRKSLSIRPTSDKCREALFSILSAKVVESRVLDLYAGTGALGIEALSRGAASAVFVDNSSTALKLIKLNIDLYNNKGNQGNSPPATSIIRHDLRNGLPAAIHALAENGSAPFDIIFLDPPYDRGLSLQTLQWLDKSPYPAQDSIIIAEERSRIVLPQKFGSFELSDSRRYGDTGLWFYTKK